MFEPKLKEPVLTQRIPSAPFGDPKDRHIVSYDEYTRTGGYKGLEKAITMTPEELVALVKVKPDRITCRPWRVFIPPPDQSQ